jgi:O-antigen/teichoic acid export membrane protein
MKLFNNSAFLLLANRAISITNGFALSLLMAHLLGFEAVGLYAIGTIPASFLNTFCDLGMSYSLPRQENLTQPERWYVSICVKCSMALPALLSSLLYSKLVTASQYDFMVVAVACFTGYAWCWSVSAQMMLVLQKREWELLKSTLTDSCFIAALAAMRVNELLTVAIVVLASRSVGACLVWGVQKYKYVPVSIIMDSAKLGTRYVVIELLGNLSSQLTSIIVAALTSRYDLGIYRTCMQVFSASNAPGFTYATSVYPVLVEDDCNKTARVRNIFVSLSVIITVLMALGSWPIGIYFFHNQDVFKTLLGLSLVSLPFYLNIFYVQRVKATGKTKAGTAISIVSLCIQAVINMILVSQFGLIGIVGALAIVFALQAWTNRWVVERRAYG